MYISAGLIFSILFRKGCNRKSPQDPLDFNRYIVSNLRAWHKDHKTLYMCYSISLSGNAINCDIVDIADWDGRISILFCKQSFTSVYLINLSEKANTDRDNPELYNLLNKITDIVSI